MKVTLLSTLVASGLALAALSGVAKAEGRLVVYCSATNEMCESETQAFGEKYNVKTSFIRNGSGEEKPAGGCLVRRHAGSSVPGRGNGSPAAL